MVKSVLGHTQSSAKSNGNHTCQVTRDMVKSVLGHTQSPAKSNGNYTCQATKITVEAPSEQVNTTWDMNV